MDPVALAYYAAVCGLLGAFAPRAGGMPARLALGAVVGVIAAGLLPWLHSLLG